MIEIERKFLMIDCGITKLLEKFQEHPELFVVHNHYNIINQCYSPPKIGRCDMRIRQVTSMLRSHSSSGWSDKDTARAHSKTLTYITFKSPSTEMGSRNEFETVTTLAPQEVSHLITELQIGHTHVTKIRHLVEYTPPEGGGWTLELDEYPQGTLVMEIENPPGILVDELNRLIDHEITGDANWLNTNYSFMKTL
jgi:CYTH domain-containing protein